MRKEIDKSRLQRKAYDLQTSTWETANRIFSQVSRTIISKSEAQKLIRSRELSDVEVRRILLSRVEALFSTKIGRYVSKPRRGKLK